ncbi:MAG TPA: TPM domain-containing protein [Pyrinomonadaceae bacterium]|nr:TPM domain-containing protein [Pyrinomonadaceae bacterium]
MLGMRQVTKSRYLAATLTALAVLAAVAAFSTNVFMQSTSDPATLQPTGFVNDYAGVFDPASKAALEKKLTDLKNSTNPQVELAVAVVRTTGGRDIFDFSRDLARTWKIGSKADDNPSALLFVAIDDRKYFTQISRDLEDELPDGLVGSLQRQYLVPEFKKGNYSKGISDTIDAYIARIRDKGNVAGVPAASPAVGTADDSMPAEGYQILCCVGIVIIGFILLGLYFARDSGRGGRGGGGGVVDSALPWVVGGIINAALNSGSSGGSDWGGSGSDGGWGGFGGGGDFGGGGAGGDW